MGQTLYRLLRLPVRRAFEPVEGREIKRSSFCLPFARGASSSYICVATVVIRHVETEKPTSCA